MKSFLCAALILFLGILGEAGTDKPLSKIATCADMLAFSSRDIYKKNIAFFRYKAYPHKFFEAHIYKEPEMDAGHLILFFPDDDFPHPIAISEIDLDSFRVFHSPVDLIKYKIETLSPNQEIEFSSYQSAEEMKTASFINKVVNGDKYIGDSLPNLLKPRPKLIEREGRFIKKDFIYPYEGFYISVLDNNGVTGEVFIPYHLVISSTLQIH